MFDLVSCCTMGTGRKVLPLSCQFITRFRQAQGGGGRYQDRQPPVFTIEALRVALKMFMAADLLNLISGVRIGKPCGNCCIVGL